MKWKVFFHFLSCLRCCDDDCMINVFFRFTYYFFTIRTFSFLHSSSVRWALIYANRREYMGFKTRFSLTVARRRPRFYFFPMHMLQSLYLHHNLWVRMKSYDKCIDINNCICSKRKKARGSKKLMLIIFLHHIQFFHYY